jgi:putative acetyltransferase
MLLNEVTLRGITPSDDQSLALIIRTTLEEFGANHPGTVYYDEETDRLSTVFSAPGSWYFVAEAGGIPVGGAGIFPTMGLPEGVCELVKMYLLPAARGIGLGKHLMNECLKKAREFGYNKVYLETMPDLKVAVPMYESFGFNYLEAPLGQSGHFGCTIRMIKNL